MPKFFRFPTFNQHPIFDFFGFDSARRVSSNHVCPFVRLSVCPFVRTNIILGLFFVRTCNLAFRVETGH